MTKYITGKIPLPEGEGNTNNDGEVVYALPVVLVNENGEIISLANPTMLNNLTDVDINSPVEGQALVYNASLVKWTNSPLNYVIASEKGAANGVATLDENNLIPLSQLSVLVAKTNVAQSFSARQSYSPVIANITGNYSLDLSQSNVFDLTLTGNVVLSATNLPTQTTDYTIILRQDGVGNRTVTLNSPFTMAKGKTFTLPGTLANEETIIKVFCDGSRLCVLSYDAWV